LAECTGEAPREVPDVIGLTVSEAASVFAANGVGLDPNSQLWHENYDVVPIISTSPAPGEVLDCPFEVNVQLAAVTVTNVVDGDTLDLSTGDRVRLIGIDTPEFGECGAAEATAFVTELVADRSVAVINPIEVDDRDNYDRLLA